MKSTITRSSRNCRLNWFAQVAFEAFIALVALGFVWESSKLTKVPGEVGPGPGAAPAVFGLLLGAIALYFLFRVLRARASQVAGEETPPVNVRQLSLVAGVFLAACVGYVLGIIAAVIFLGIWSGKLVDRFSWVRSISVTAASLVVMYVIFDLGLNVHLPLVSVPW
ncbi:tripartite tricarboxylate transporter TctB family protein [Dietzia maris]